MSNNYSSGYGKADLIGMAEAVSSELKCLLSAKPLPEIPKKITAMDAETVDAIRESLILSDASDLCDILGALLPQLIS